MQKFPRYSSSACQSNIGNLIDYLFDFKIQAEIYFLN
jgi:hypothetical protein